MHSQTTRKLKKKIFIPYPNNQGGRESENIKLKFSYSHTTHKQVQVSDGLPWPLAIDDVLYIKETYITNKSKDVILEHN